MLREFSESSVTDVSKESFGNVQRAGVSNVYH